MVIHLVKSQPPQPGARQGSNSSASGSHNTNASDGSGRHGGPRYFGRVDGGTMFGSVVIPVIGDAGLNCLISCCKPNVSFSYLEIILTLIFKHLF